MILPSHMSVSSLLHLAHPSGDQIEDLQQGMGVRRSDGLLHSSASKVDVLAVQKPQETITAQQIINNSKSGSSIAAEFNTISKRNRSLRSDSADLVLNNQKIHAVKKENDNYSQSDAEQQAEEEFLLHSGAMQAVVDVSLNISRENVFDFFLVAMFYDPSVNNNRQKHIMLVAPLQLPKNTSSKIDVSAHTTFVIANNNSGSPVVTNLPAQLVTGYYGHLNDWMTVSCMPLSFNTLEAQSLGFDQFFQMNVTAFDQSLNGAAAIVGGSMDLAKSPLSVHAPGANKLWSEEKSQFAEFEMVEGS